MTPTCIFCRPGAARLLVGLLFLPLLVVLSGTARLQAQTWYSRTGHVSFFSHTSVEDIEAHNHQATALLKLPSGELAVSMLIKSFQFEIAKMQEHFNENYLHSTTYPKATFEGKLTDPAALNLKKAGTQILALEGNLTIHGVTRPIKTTAALQVTPTGIGAQCTFKVKLADFKVDTKGASGKIADEVEVKVDLNLQPK